MFEECLNDTGLLPELFMLCLEYFDRYFIYKWLHIDQSEYFLKCARSRTCDIPQEAKDDNLLSLYNG